LQYGIVSHMRLAKRTYSLPPDLVHQFEERLAPGERSRFLANLIEQWLAERQREELRRDLIEGCKEMGEVYEEVDREWNRAADEVWRDAG
jgi:hypothetical protein